MEMQSDKIESEQIADSFLCCVCSDLLYKPVVLACGHASCFWCVHLSMSGYREAHCPLCRHPYCHFPAICQMLHALLLKMYPLTYKRREKQTLDEEKKMGFFSPNLDEFRASQDISHQILIADVLCATCKKLLFRPVVLNCGHERFTEEHVARKITAELKLVPIQHENQSNGSQKVFKNGVQFPAASDEKFSEWCFSNSLKVHFGVGCDYCGMIPIIGKRYKCKDCKEKMGFDLCEDCYNSHSKLPGRFNQQHTSDHTFVIEKAHGL